jgi:purine nucleoside permease
MSRRRLVLLAALLGATALALGLLTSTAYAKAAQPVAAKAAAGSGRFEVRALALTTFAGEEQPWLTYERWPLTFQVPGGFAPVHCQQSGVCVTMTGETKSNSGPSTMAILLDPQFKFTDHTVFMMGGISGIRSSVGTLGDVGIANWIVDLDLGTTFVNSSQAPPNGWLPFADYDQAASRLNERLAALAYQLTSKIQLVDDQAARIERAYYGKLQAREKPSVMRCDTGGSDDFWLGNDWANRADAILRYRIRQVDPGYNGYRCSSEFEDPAIASALSRFGFLDQLIDIRSASDFEDQRPGTSPRDLYNLLQSPQGFAGYAIATENAYLVATRIAHYVAAHPGAVAFL